MKYFVSQWEQITNDKNLLDIVQHCHFEFVGSELPIQKAFSQCKFNNKESEIIDMEVAKLLDEKVIIPVDYHPQQYLSLILLRPKKNGEYRMILNLKKLNEHIPYCHFKMDHFEIALNMVTKDMYFCSLDIRKAYYSIPIAKEQQMLFRFSLRDKIFQFCCMPNGISSGPRLFTKLMKPVYAKLHHEGHFSSGYIDDSLLGGETFSECEAAVSTSMHLFTSLGFLMNYDKSVLIPTQQITFLGNIIDSRQMIVTLPDEKKEKIKTECLALLKCKQAKIRKVAQVIGLLVSSFSAVEFGKLHYREIEREKILALKCNKGDFEADMLISDTMKSELTWWVENVRKLEKLDEIILKFV